MDMDQVFNAGSEMVFCSARAPMRWGAGHVPVRRSGCSNLMAIDSVETELSVLYMLLFVTA